jgi:hypothetical protein
MKTSTILSLFAGILLSSAANAVNLGQVDDFQNNTTQGWQEGGASPNPPTNESGGPGGASDRYLRNQSVCCGAGGRNTMFNRAQWSGDFIGAGIGRIQATARAFGNEGMQIRIHFKRNDGGSEWITNGIPLPADGQWHTLVFSLAAADMSSVAGLGTHQEMMANVGEMRIGNYPQAAATPPMVDAILGVDDITALAPEAPPEPEVPDDVLLDLVTLGDVNTSGTADLAVMAAALEDSTPAAANGTQASHLDTTDVIHVRDGGTGKKIVEFEVTNAWHSQAMDTITTGAGILLAIMQTDDSGATRVLLYDALDGTLVKTIPFFDTSWSAVDLVAVRDAAGAGLEGVGVLATNTAGQHAIEVRKPGNGALIDASPARFFNDVWTTFGANDMGDFNGNGRSELAVLARNGAGKNAVEIRDALSGVRISRIFYLGPANNLVDFDSADDVNSNGRPEIIVLGKKDGGPNTAHAKDGKTGDLIAKPVMLGPQWTTFALRTVDDLNGNSSPEIAAIATNAANITNVQVRDLLAATVTSRFGFLGPVYDPRDMEVLDDVSGNNLQELVVVGRRDDTGQIRVQIRDGKTGQKWKNIDLPVQ